MRVYTQQAKNVHYVPGAKHGEGKTRHGLRRAVRRRRWNVAIQVYLTAAAMNLKVLAGLLSSLFYRLIRSQRAREELKRLPHCHFQHNRVTGQHLDKAA